MLEEESLVCLEIKFGTAWEKTEKRPRESATTARGRKASPLFGDTGFKQRQHTSLICTILWRLSPPVHLQPKVLADGYSGERAALGVQAKPIKDRNRAPILVWIKYLARSPPGSQTEDQV